MNIVQVSKEKNVTTDSLRYYERIGLIPPVTRIKGGGRDYTEEDLHWVEFVKCMRAAGLSIESLIEYTRLCGEGPPTVPARIALLADECDLLEKRILGLQEALAQLKEKVDGYEGMLKG